MWFRNKKGALEMKTIIKIALITLAFIIIIGLFSRLFAQTSGKSSEELCHTYNTLTSIGGKTAEFAKGARAVPIACQNLDLFGVPTKEYPQDTQGAMTQIGDLAARCWWMWLEGVDGKNVIGAGTSRRKCFICYNLYLDEKISFQSGDLDYFFDTQSYTVKDEGDKCAPLGGGQCRDKCEGTLSKEIESKKCKRGQKCCVTENRRDECVNKGGNCTTICEGEYSEEYSGWQCSSGNRCCLKKENYFTYRDYIQKFGGSGALVVKPGNFDSKDIYAVVFSEDPAFANQITGVELTTRVADQIMIVPLNNVTQECAVQQGATT